MHHFIDINCDMGESFGAYALGRDEEVIRFISSANIACGFHASDPAVMDRTVRLCRDHRVSIGAHPGYPERQYTDEGELVPRKLEIAVLKDPERIAERAVAMVVKKGVESINGRWIDLTVDTLCIHGDNLESIDAARKMVDAFTREGIQIKPLGEIIPR